MLPAISFLDKHRPVSLTFVKSFKLFINISNLAGNVDFIAQGIDIQNVDIERLEEEGPERKFKSRMDEEGFSDYKSRSGESESEEEEFNGSKNASIYPFMKN